MPNVHKSNPVQFRPPAEDREWLLAHHKATGRPVNAILAQALREYREKADAALTQHHQPETAPLPR